MRIQYRKLKNGIEIVRCYGTDPVVVLPDFIDGIPVVRVAAYTFSARKSEEDTDVLEYLGESIQFTDEHLLAGMEIQEIVFPDSVESIGNYIFYGCKSLKRLEFSDRLQDIGSGAFTGADGIENLEVHLNDTEKSCVKEILGDLWQRIDVTFYYKNSKETVKLVFPEHYEEAVENTPARILFTQHHGTGNNYRQCFTAKEVDFRKYDELFFLASVLDKTEVLIDLVFSRLIYSKGLTEKNKASYQNYIQMNLQEIIQKVIKEINKEINKFTILHEISQNKMWTKDAMELALQTSAQVQDRELTAWLMNENYKFFGQCEEKREVKKKKKFAL